MDLAPYTAAFRRLWHCNTLPFARKLSGGLLAMSSQGTPFALPAQVHVVSATAKGAERLWAVALPRENAIEAIKQRVGPEWQLALTNRRLTVEEIAVLELCRGGVRRLKYIK
jgi:hypothetical protein